jgi:glutaredoxin
MSVKVYSMPSCGGCIKAKELLNQRGIQYEEMIIGEHLTPKEFFAEFADVRFVPHIIMDDKEINGYDELAEELKNV